MTAKDITTILYLVWQFLSDFPPSAHVASSVSPLLISPYEQILMNVAQENIENNAEMFEVVFIRRMDPQLVSTEREGEIA